MAGLDPASKDVGLFPMGYAIKPRAGSTRNAPPVPPFIDFTDSAADCVEGIGKHGGDPGSKDNNGHVGSETLYDLRPLLRRFTIEARQARQPISFEAFTNVSKQTWKQYVFHRRPQGDCNQQQPM